MYTEQEYERLITCRPISYDTPTLQPPPVTEDKIIQNDQT